MCPKSLKFVGVMTLIPFLSVACNKDNSVSVVPTVNSSTTPTAVESPSSQSQPTKKIDDSQLIDIHSVNKNILIDIRYATENNFMKRKVYPVARCLLRFSVAKKLSEVQEELAQQGLGLKVYDCYRPLSVQKQMWEIVSDPRYVANPSTGSRHNRGAAVDVTLVDRTGKELEMPSEYDNFTARAHRNYTNISDQAKKNRLLLEEIMQKHQFVGLPTEWWHFDALGWEKFPLLDVPLDNV